MKHLRYGWIPDLPDARDQIYCAPRKTAALPASVDLRSACPPVYDQGQLGSCTANAIAAAISFDQSRQKMAQPFAPSRLYIYYNERVIEGTTATDSGAMLRDGIKAVVEEGACPEPLWPYNESNYAEKPPPQCYNVGKLHPAVQYSRVPQSLAHLKSCLAAGYPFAFGFTVYESFESDAVADSGVAPMPGSSEGTVGGHAVLAVGYMDSLNRFFVRNSWGSDWGLKGYFTLPYEYLENSDLLADFWTIRLVK